MSVCCVRRPSVVSDSEVLWAAGSSAEWVAMPSSGDPPNPGIEPKSPALQVDSSLSEPRGKPKVQEYESGQPSSSPGDPPDPGIELASSALQVDSLPAELSGSPVQKSCHFVDYLAHGVYMCVYILNIGQSCTYLRSEVFIIVQLYHLTNLY